MRKALFTVLCLSMCIVSIAQNKDVQKDIKDIKFFGIDFSLARTYGGEELIGQFTEAFQRINGLFITEANKYDIAKYFKKNVTATAVRQLEELNESISKETFYSDSETYQISNNELAEEIKRLPLKETDGTGLIFVAELLNKGRGQATHHIVFFDIASRDILDSWKATGKAKGFGLRNYWARSIFDILKNVKIKK
ncbi:MAG: hypothetical protein LBG19_06345 [Prevotellaceae bacterium]|jgi:hypothetical protein|nr:hypothetical protein [Prevotellaceae bacterium]